MSPRVSFLSLTLRCPDHYAARKPARRLLTATPKMPRPFAESTLLTLLSLLRIACGAILTIDDADPRIQYTGAWVPNTGGDPQQLNYMATLTYSNVTGTIASFQFTGKYNLV